MGDVDISVQPHGEKLRKALKWISEFQLENKDMDRKKILRKALIRFDLSPKESDFLEKNFL